MLEQSDKAVGAILYGVLFVIVLKSTQALLQYCAPDFASTHPFISVGFASIIGLLIAIFVVTKLFPKFFEH